MHNPCALAAMTLHHPLHYAMAKVTTQGRAGTTTHTQLATNCYVVHTYYEMHLKWSLKGCLFTWLLLPETSSTVQDAKAQLQHVLAKDPSNGHAWHTLGQMAEETGDLQEAAHCYTKGAKSSGMPSSSPQSLLYFVYLC